VYFCFYGWGQHQTGWSIYDCLVVVAVAVVVVVVVVVLVKEMAEGRKCIAAQTIENIQFAV